MDAERMRQTSDDELAVRSVQAASVIELSEGIEIRELTRGRLGSLAHCTVRPGAVSHAAMHKNFEELWYVLAGDGQLWLRCDQEEYTTELRPGLTLAIPVAAHFQFRNRGPLPLEFVIASVPPFPGAQQVGSVAGPWT